MGVIVNIRRVPNFLKAQSPLFLRRLCLRKNMLDGTEHKYTILHDGKNWFAWFYEEAKMKLEIKKGGLTATIDEQQEKKDEELKEKVPNG